MDDVNSSKKLGIAQDTDADLAHRVASLEDHFEFGGRVAELERWKTFLAGMWTAAMLSGGLLWYLVERFLEVVKR